MKNYSLKQIVGPALLLIALLAGCQQQPQLTVAFTATPAPTQTEASQELPATPTSLPLPIDTPIPTDTPTMPPATDTPIPTDTPEPTATPSPIPAETPTPVIPLVTVDVDLNVRSGPGTNYNQVGLLAAGTTVVVVGKNEDTTWWQIDYPDGPDGLAWIAIGYGTAQNTDGVAVANIPPTPIPPTPAVPTPTPIPTTPPVDFVIVKQRLWSNEENGGISPNGTVSNCGYGHEIHVSVTDAAGQPLDGVLIKDIYNNPPQITGSKGPGRAQYLLYFDGYNLFVAEDPGAGRPVTSETSPVLSAKDEEIPIPWLIEGHYCATEAECVERISKNSLCRGHYSFDLVFQRTW
jgi:hypothetical protein